MASFTNLMLVVLAIQFVLVLLGIADLPMTGMYNFLINPTSWELSDLSSLISDALLLVGSAGILIGLIFYKSDFIVFAGIVSVFFSFGKPIANLYNLISSQSDSSIAMLFISPLILIYILTLLKFWRGSA